MKTLLAITALSISITSLIGINSKNAFAQSSLASSGNPGESEGSYSSSGIPSTTLNSPLSGVPTTIHSKTPPVQLTGSGNQPLGTVLAFGQANPIAKAPDMGGGK